MPNQNETPFHLPDGRDITVVQPGTKGSKNWRLTEEAYRRYEPHIRTALRNWPQETKFTIPAGVSPNTFEHRLRDALQAVSLYGYDEDVQARLKEIRVNLHVSMDPSGSAVWIREKQQRGRPMKMHAEVNERPQPIAEQTVLDVPDEMALRAMATLSSKKIVTTPYFFRGKIDGALQDAIMHDFDVWFSYDDMKDLTMLM